MTRLDRLLVRLERAAGSRDALIVGGLAAAVLAGVFVVVLLMLAGAVQRPAWGG